MRWSSSCRATIPAGIWPLWQSGRRRGGAEAGSPGGRRRRHSLQQWDGRDRGPVDDQIQAGDEIVFFDECYHRSREFCELHLARFGVVTHQVKTCDYDAMESKISPRTKMLISESPTNPHMSIVDLERFVDIGRRHRVETLIDATLATPYNLQPIALGCRLRIAFGDEVPGWPQRLAGRRTYRSRRRL